VILIIDSLPVHHSKPVKQWLEAHTKEIEFHYLSSYSPERNPDEHLNRDLKHQASNRPPARNRDQVEMQIATVMKRIQRSSDKIKSYYKNSNVSYTCN
jgi:hypothetical protein